MSSSSSKLDNHTLFNLPNSIGSSTRVPTLFPEDYEVWALHMEDYLQVLVDGYQIWKSVILGPYTFNVDNEVSPITVTSIEQYEKLKLTITLSKENKERIDIDLKATAKQLTLYGRNSSRCTEVTRSN